MLVLIARRLAMAIPTLLCVVVLSFLLVRKSPGSPFASEKALAPQVRAALEQRYGLNAPLHVQLGRYLRNLCAFDLGPSIKYPEHTVAEIIAQAWPVSALLAAAALGWALLLGGGLGMGAALWPHLFIGRFCSGACSLLMGTPSFVLAPLLAWGLSGPRTGLPPAGFGELRHLWLPSLTLGALISGGLGQLLAAGLSRTLASDYVRTARAKGLSQSAIVWRHALWGALGPVAAYLAPACAGLLAGSVAVEQIFNVPGLGPYVVDAAQNRDYFLIMGIVLTDAVLLIGLNVLADVAVAFCDPRVDGAMAGATR